MEEQPRPDVCQVEGNFYAWRPDPDDPFSGVADHGRTADELAAKLAG